MAFSGSCMDDDLRAVGGWVEDGVLGQSAKTRPRQREGERRYWYQSAEPHHRGPWSDRAASTRSSRPNHTALSRAEEELLDRLSMEAIKEIRAAQMIQRQHPACFVKAEGGQQGNEATAKPSGGLSRVERHFKQASAYLLPDGHDTVSAVGKCKGRSPASPRRVSTMAQSGAPASEPAINAAMPKQWPGPPDLPLVGDECPDRHGVLDVLTLDSIMWAELGLAQ
ncbi:hypothetical protein NUW58_g3391 [Xylaria curta]|uniref:Uncharacterized protein n=1 Tax=Xylaria curta TaxID=42375 RepID=A0ACC1PEB1_9PEZI|nr:hypothetical protein NUW58_g3391 [Xylaria curta]